MPESERPTAPTPVPVRVERPARAPRRRRRSIWGEIWRWGVTVALFAILASAIIGVGVLAAIYRQARLDQARPVDAIVVLGTAQWNGQPGPVLRSRLDHALALYERGLAPTVVVTGGRAPGDEFTEAEAAQQYLLDRGVPPAAILLENAGRDTWQSMRGVAALLAPPPPPGATMPPPRVLIVSDGFHLLRTKLMARDLGLEPYASAAPDSPIRPGGPGELSYAVREALAIAAYLVGLRNEPPGATA